MGSIVRLMWSIIRFMRSVGPFIRVNVPWVRSVGRFIRTRVPCVRSVVPCVPIVGRSARSGFRLKWTLHRTDGIIVHPARAWPDAHAGAANIY